MKIPGHVRVTVGTAVKVELPDEKGSATVVEVEHEPISGRRKVVVEVRKHGGFVPCAGAAALNALERVLVGRLQEGPQRAAP